MKINLSQGGFNILKYTLTVTGEKEVNSQGIEVDSQRRLNGEDSAQRRFFLKIVNPLLEEKRGEAQKLLDEHKEVWKKENVKGEEETEKEYETRLNVEMVGNKKLNDEIGEILKTKMEVDLTNKTFDVVKKYYNEFGDKNGWLVGDDEIVEEINAELNK